MTDYSLVCAYGSYTIVTSSSALASTILALSPYAYFKLDETSGTTAANSSTGGSGFDGTASGVTWGQIAAPGGGLAPYFNGVNSYIDILTAALQAAYNGEEITVIVWWKVYAQAQWTDAQIRQIVKLWTDANNRILIEKYLTDNWYVAWYKAGGTLDYRVDVASNNTNWHMSALTVSNAADQYKMYTDGVQVSSTQIGIGDWAGVLTSALIGLYSTATNSYPWKGYISNIALYSSAKTAEQIASVYASGTAEDWTEILVGRKLAIGQGSFALTGQDLTLDFGYYLACSCGEYGLYGDPYYIQFQTTCTTGDTFDPTITLRAGCPYTPKWDFGNGDTATGLAISYAGYTDAGPHTVTLVIPNIRYWLTGIDVYNDKITGDFLGAISECLSLTSIRTGENTSLSSNLSSLANLTALTTLNLREHQTSLVGDISVFASLPNLAYIYIAGTGIYGDIANLAGLAALYYIDLHSNTTGTGINGDLADLSAMTQITDLRLGNTYVTGDLSDIAALILVTVLMLYNTTVTGDLSDLEDMDLLEYLYTSGAAITGGDVGSNPYLEYCIIASHAWNAATVDNFLAVLYANRAIYTRTVYGARHYISIGGTNATPSGVYQDATPPTTGLEYIYKLVNDPDSDGFVQWTALWNGGSAP